ncbi:MAG: GEVED domain-containing protein [Bacteroidota bacterium]
MKTIYFFQNLKFRFAMLLLILTTSISFVNSQNITNYAFAPSAGTFIPLSGGTTATLSGGTNDEGYYNLLPIGFNFTYMGVPYTNFSASTNGWMTFGQAITAAALTNALPTGGTPRPVIAPLWDDNDMSSGTLSYQTSGSVGNRVLTVEWLNVEWYYTANTSVISYQAKLYEATGVIEFIYRQEAGAVATGSASIGISAIATGVGNFLSLNNTSTAPAISSTVETATISTKPLDGQTYRFTPPSAPAAPISFTASPVGISSITVSWLDNSLTESGFFVYRSLDNVNFTLVGTIPSTTSSTTATSYSLNQTGLTANTQYYYNIVSFNEAWLSATLNGNATTLAGIVCGTKTVGPTGNYTSLTAAFADIALNGLQCSSILELQAAYVSTVESFPITIPYFGNSTTTTLTVRPEVGATNLSIISDSLQTLNLNGATALIFDGRAGGVGASVLTIGNTRTTGAAISFINGASYNNFHDLVIKGVNSSATSGVITFLTSTGILGNSHNTFQYNAIRDGATAPNNLVYSAGSASAPNTGNSIVNNTLFNFFNPASTSAAVSVGANNSDWTISNNKIYQEVTRTYTTGTQHYGIRIVSSTGNNFIINNNTIGYTSSAGTGTYTMAGTVATRFSAIALSAGTITASSIQGNMITNIALTTSSTTSTAEGVFAGIAVLAGSVDIGTTAANLIGSSTINNVINITSSSSGGALVGIYSTSSGIVSILNNKIGGLSASGTAAIGNTIRGINTSGSGNYTISGNEIGSSTLANNIRAGVLGTTTGSTIVTGIENAGSGTNTISLNSITNISAFGSSTTSLIKGISNTSGIGTISTNTISLLTTASLATSFTVASVIGINQTSTTAGQNVIGNSIFSLSNTAATAVVGINGIYYSGGATGTNIIEKNYIRNLTVASTGAAQINGIHINNGVSTYKNNRVDLGAGLTSGTLTLSGIRDNATAANNFYFNSVQIAGSGVTVGTANTHAYIRVSTGVTDIKNNILVNSRANSGGTGKHYAINLNLSTTVTAENNDYYYPSAIMGAVATTDYPSIVNWKAGTNLDVSSITVDPMFTTDLHINNTTASSLESGGVLITGINTDFDNDSRPGPIGSINGGGTNPDIGADEFDGFPVIPAAPISFTAAPIGLTTMTVSWLDNSTTESGFAVYRSPDNITFALVGTLPSTSTSTIATSYSLNQTGLIPSTIYYYKIVSLNAAQSSSALTGNATTLSATFCGTKTVGPTGIYPSLTAAFADIAANGLSCNSTLDLQAAYLSTVETFPITIPYFANSNLYSLTVRPELGATNLSITSDSLQTLNLNGATTLIFDGRAGGIGAANLTIENGRKTGAAISFINGASYNNFHDLVIKGVDTLATSGVVTFLTSTSAVGNNNNTFQNNNISNGVTTPTNLIYSAGSVSAPNTGNSILNNNLFNFFNPVLTTAAVSVAANNSAWTISNNKVYQEVARTYTTGTIHYGIRVVSSTGINFTINNNTVGYSSMSATGVYILDGTVATRFSAISLTADDASPSNIQGNIVNNISLKTANTSSTTTGVFSGIAVLGGSVNIGTTSPNLIGSGIANDVIAITSTVSGGALVGIYTTSSGTMNILNNKIGGFSASGIATIGNTIRGINTAGSGSYTISGNEIGSLTLADNMRAGIMGTTTASTDVSGIENTSSATSLISLNKINNLSSYGAGTAGQIKGISSTSGVSTISNNQISFLTTAAGVTGTTNAASVIGISKTGTAANQSVSGNTISNLLNTSAAAAITINGIYYTGAPSGTNLITNNTIKNLSAVTTGLGLINGIYVGGGVSTFANNMIAIGLDATGASVTLGNLSLSGIRLATTVANNFYFNSVHITGSNVTTGTASSHAFIRTLTGITEIKNNIFVNTRSNSTGSGKHYAINLNLTTTVIAGNNDYYFPTGMMGVVASTDYPLLGNWKISTGLDASSIKVDPMFISSTDLHINNSTSSSLESGGVVVAAVSSDFDSDSRPGPVGSINGGGTKPDIGADEFDGSPINLDMGATVLVSPVTTGCYSANETVRVRIKNYAGAVMDFSSNPISVNVEVAGPNPIVFTPVDIYSGTLASGATLDTTVSATYNMTVAGQYIFKASTVLSGDANNGNDSMVVVTETVSGGTVIAASGSICSGSSITLAATGYTSGGTIQWQNSPDGTIWSDIIGATSPATTYTSATGLADTMYFRVVSCGLNNSVVDTVISEYVVPPTPTPVARCGPGPVTLSAAGTGTLYWYGTSTGGPILGTGATFTTPAITASTTYYVAAASAPSATVTLGAGATTGTSYDAIFYHLFGGEQTQFLVKASELTALGLTAGNISNLGINMAAGTAMAYNGFAISIGNTTNTNMSAGIYNGVLNPVYSASSYTPTTGINTFVLNSPFSWDGVSNIVIKFCWSNNNSGSTSNYAKGDVTSFVSCAYYRADNQTSGVICGGTTGSGTASRRPQFIFTQTGCKSAFIPVTATVTAPPAMSIASASPAICFGDSTTISMTSANPYTYTWSPAGSLNATTGSSVVAKPTVTTKYYVHAVDGVSCTNTDSITINVNQLPTPLPPVASPAAICIGASSQLSISEFVPQAYCVPRMSTIQANGDYLKSFTFGNISNLNSGDAATDYTYYNSLTANVVAAVSNSLTLESGGTTSTYAEQFRIWIDYNQNGIFETTESVFNTTASSFSPNVVLGSVTVPVTAYNGITRMRVMAKYSSTPLVTESCLGTSTYGEYEDYNVHITGATNNPSTGYLYSWTADATLSDITISNPIATPTVTTTYYVSVSNPLTGCTINDSIKVTVNSNPIVNLGVDTVICSNLSLILNAGLNYTTYAWSTTAATQTVTVNTAATYSVTVTDANGCVGSDAINVTVNAAPVISLGVDSTICDGQSVALSPGNGFAAYNWSTGASTAMVSAISTDDYSVIVTDGNQCKGYDTVAITVNALPVVTLGADIDFCQNDSRVLDAGAGFVSYSWSNSTSLQTTTVSTDGTYSVTVTDNNGCSNSDAITVVVNALPVVNLGTDQTFCLNDSYTLDAGNGFSTYEWSDNSTLQTLVVGTAGTYSVTVTDNNGCSNSDAIVVAVNALPVINLGSDLTFCMNDSVTLDAGNGFNIYSWSDNSTMQTLKVSTAGTYSVTVTDNNGCTNFDAISVVVKSLPVISLGPDTVICKNEEFIVNAGSGFSGYLWNNSATTQSIVVDGDVLAAGNYSYSVIVSGSNGCEATDTVVVKVDLCAGIKEENEVAVFSLYPNPSQGEFTIATTSSSKNDIVIEVADIEGRVIYKEKINKFTSKTIQLNNAAPGIYFVKIQEAENSRIQKLIIN